MSQHGTRQSAALLAAEKAAVYVPSASLQPVVAGPVVAGRRGASSHGTVAAVATDFRYVGRVHKPGSKMAGEQGAAGRLLLMMVIRGDSSKMVWLGLCTSSIILGRPKHFLHPLLHSYVVRATMDRWAGHGLTVLASN